MSEGNFDNAKKRKKPISSRLDKGGPIVLVDADELKHLEDIDKLSKPFDSLVARQKFVQDQRLRESGSLKNPNR
ncbi:MAG TPA: hypothetical protein VJB96_03540 [Patescibacteria group bacterium]|nr:hypothetical protein [Patescibacteria group bacterium]